MKAAVISRYRRSGFWKFGFLLAALIALLGVPRHAHADIGADGADGVNIAWEAGTSPNWYIELQRAGADLVHSGVSQNKPAKIEQGLLVLDWGFAHEAADGSFPGTAGGSTGQMFHSTAIFAEGAASATLELRGYDPDTYADVITRYTKKLQSIAGWLTRPDIVVPAHKYDFRFTHRRYLLACGLAEIAALVPDDADAEKLSDTAADYARDGLSLMLPHGSRAVITHNPDWSVPPAYLLRPDQPNPPQVNGQYARGVHVINGWGINPEKEGYDASYQMVGVLFAERYYPFCQDELLKAHLLSMIRRTCLWELSRMDSNGHILVIGSSRIGFEDNRAGFTKTVNIGAIRRTFLYGYTLTGDTRLRDASLRVN